MVKDRLFLIPFLAKFAWVFFLARHFCSDFWRAPLGRRRSGVCLARLSGMGCLMAFRGVFGSFGWRLDGGRAWRGVGVRGGAGGAGLVGIVVFLLWRQVFYRAGRRDATFFSHGG